MSLQTSSSPTAGLARAGAYFGAAMLAALFAAEFVAVDGALAYSVDGIFGLGHLPAYAIAVLVGLPSIWVIWCVFRTALAWELSNLGPRASGDTIADLQRAGPSQ